MLSNNSSSQIEYHTVGGESTNFYDQEHNLVTMLIANQQNMHKVFKYFFDQGITSMKNRHLGKRENFDDIFYKFNKMNFEEIESKINPQREIETITIDDDSTSNIYSSEMEEPVIICIDPSSPSYEYPTEVNEDSIDLCETTRKRKRNESYSSEENDTTGQLESEEISKRLADIEEYYAERDHKRKQYYFEMDTSVERNNQSIYDSDHDSEHNKNSNNNSTYRQ